MEIRRVRPEEWRRLREIRLRALADAPEAFGRTPAEERARPEADWRRWTAFLAEDGDRWLGLAATSLDGDTAHVLSMWVEPAGRRRGAGTALLAAIVGWAREQGAARVELGLADGNDAAQALYERAGFAFTGEQRPLRSQSERRERTMVRTLEPAGASPAPPTTRRPPGAPAPAPRPPARASPP